MNQAIQKFLGSGSNDWNHYLEICREELAKKGEDPDDIFHGELMALYLLDRHDEVVARYRDILPLLKNEGYIRSISNTVQISLYKTGIQLAEAGDVEKAFEHFKESVRLDPECETAHYCLGKHYQDQQQYYMAMHHYYEALKIKPEFPEIYNNLAVIQFEDEGDIRTAIQHIETAIQQNPSNDLLQKMYISLTRLYKLIADYDKEDFYMQKLLQLLGFPPESDFEGEEEHQE